MDKYMEACELFSGNLRHAYEKYHGGSVEEMRLRLNRLPTVYAGGREIAVRSVPVQRQEIMSVIDKATGASYSANLSRLKEGYLNYKGLRIGFCARALIRDGVIQNFADFNSLNIRIPGELSCSTESLLQELDDGFFANTLIISPPGTGKTTLLRCIIKHYSEKMMRICVVDERNELAAMESGTAFFNLGPYTDVLTGVNKANGTMMLLRGMNPDIIAMDEISKSEDVNSLMEIVGCGVGLLATAHALNYEDMKKRPVYQKIISENIFKNIICISMLDGERKYRLKRL